MKILNSLNLLKLETILIPVKNRHGQITTTRDQKPIRKLHRPHNGLMRLNHLELFKIIIILSPNPNRIIIPTTDQRTIIHPLNTLHIISMSFQNIFTLILIRRGIELPNPNILVTTA